MLLITRHCAGTVPSMWHLLSFGGCLELSGSKRQPGPKGLSDPHCQVITPLRYLKKHHKLQALTPYPNTSIKTSTVRFGSQQSLARRGKMLSGPNLYTPLPHARVQALGSCFLIQESCLAPHAWSYPLGPPGEPRQCHLSAWPLYVCLSNFLLHRRGMRLIIVLCSLKKQALHTSAEVGRFKLSHSSLVSTQVTIIRHYFCNTPLLELEINFIKLHNDK